MLIEQQKDLGRQLVRITGEGGCSLKTDFREQMLLHNDIEGVVPFTVQREDGKNVYEYAVSGKESLSQYCENKRAGTEFLRSLLQGVLRTIYRGREFMLLEQDYVIGPDTIFLDENGKPGIPYFPGYGKKLRIQLRELAEYLMDNIDYNDNDAVLLTYGFYMKVKDESCSIETLMDAVMSSGKRESQRADEQKNGRRKNGEEQEFRYSIGSENVKCGYTVGDTYTEQSLKMVPEKSSAEEKQRRSEDETINPGAWEIFTASSGKLKLLSVFIPFTIFIAELGIFELGAAANPITGEKDLIKGLGLIALGVAVIWSVERKIWTKFARSVTESFKSAAESEDECTVLLVNDGLSKYPFQLLSDEYPSICAGRFPFYIGKDPETSDYVLNKTGVSRYHMKVDKEGETFFISDLSSTNGTYLNGVRLKPYEKSAVRRGDEIRIAACTFYCN